MNSKSRQAQRLVDHLLEGESTYGDIGELREILSAHAASLAPAVLARIAALTTATDHGWNFVTGEEFSESVDCAPAARLARHELERRRKAGPDLVRAERERARRRSAFAAMARRPNPEHLRLLIEGLTDRRPMAGRADRRPMAGRADRRPMAGRADRRPMAGRADRGPRAGRADPDLDVCVRAAKALGKLGDRKAVPALAHALESPDSDLREAAATALGRLGGPRACAALRARVSDDTDTVAAKVADALGALRDVRAIEPLLTLFGHTWTEYAEPHAFRALLRIGPRAIPAVRRAVTTQRYERAFLIPLLARLDPRGAPAVLIPLLDAKDVGTVDAAIEALGRIGGKKALAALEAKAERTREFDRCIETLQRALAGAARGHRRRT